MKEKKESKITLFLQAIMRVEKQQKLCHYESGEPIKRQASGDLLEICLETNWMAISKHVFAKCFYVAID